MAIGTTRLGPLRHEDYWQFNLCAYPNNIVVSEPLTACSDTGRMTGARAAFYEEAVIFAKVPHTLDSDTIEGFIKHNEGFSWTVEVEPTTGDLVIGYGFDITTGGHP